MKCTMCLQTADMSGYRMGRWKKTGRAYCGKACSRAYVALRSSETMARTNREHASARMKSNNPMHRDDNLERMRATLLRLNHQPKVRGGNGRPATDAEQMLVEVLGPLGFSEQTIVPTRKARGSGYPSHYKIDCGNAALKIGVEADGRSHDCPSRRGQDAKKDAFLTGIGWTVLRFTNAEILGSPMNVLTMVLSIILRSRDSTLT